MHPPVVADLVAVGGDLAREIGIRERRVAGDEEGRAHRMLAIDLQDARHGHGVELAARHLRALESPRAQKLDIASNATVRDTDNLGECTEGPLGRISTVTLYDMLDGCRRAPRRSGSHPPVLARIVSVC